MYPKNNINFRATENEAILNFNGFELNDEGEYSCKISNNQGIEITKCQIEVEKPKVKKNALPLSTERQKINNIAPNNKKAPLLSLNNSENENEIILTKHLRSQNLAEGEPLVLEIEAKSNTEFDLVWLRNGKEIPENPDFLRERIKNLFKLTVNEIYPEDSGVFSGELISKSTNKSTLTSCSVVVKGNNNNISVKYKT
jgi:hypothetical protein